MQPAAYQITKELSIFTCCEVLHDWQKSASPPEHAIADEKRWEPRHSLGGHSGPVVDLAWSPDGAILLSASQDQTARITALSAQGTWLELARPQVALVMAKAKLDGYCPREANDTLQVI